MPEIFKLHNGPQTIAFCSEAQELLYGGALGGGKTLFLIFDALGIQFRNHPIGMAAYECPQYRAVLFRRKSSEFLKLVEEGQEYYVKDFGAKFIFGRRGDPGPSFTFKSGARIFVCHLSKEANKHDHDSNEYQYIGFDQLEQFTVSQYGHLLTRGRNKIPGLGVRYRATANWIGPGLKWVRTRFYPRNKSFLPYEVTWWIPDMDIVKNPQGLRADPYSLGAISRQFIPARLTDNPSLMLNDPSYASRIKIRGKKYEQALLDGDPDAFSGDFFELFNPSLKEQGGMCVEPFPIPARWTLSVSIDPGWASPFSLGLHAQDLVGNHYRIGTYYVANTNMQKNVDDAYSFVENNKWTRGRIPEVWIAGLDAWARHDKLAIIGEELTFADLFELKGVSLQRAVTDRINGWGAMKDCMAQGRWFYFDGCNDDLIDEIQATEHDENNVNDIKGCGNSSEVSDHALDEERYY